MHFRSFNPGIGRIAIKLVSGAHHVNMSTYIRDDREVETSIEQSQTNKSIMKDGIKFNMLPSNEK